MAEERVQRKLAAILAADAVGYSRLMGADEAGTLAALKAHRKELIEPKAALSMGDGPLMELPLFNLPGLTSRRRHSEMAQRRKLSHLP